MLLTSELLAEYAVEMADRDLPDSVEEKAKRLTLDTLGCCLGGYTSPPSKRLRSVYGGSAGTADATVLCSGTPTSLEYAGLLNTTMARYLDYNDTYISQGRACHPSDHIPALLAVAEAEERSGADLLQAIALAYEVEGLGLDTGVTWDNGYDYVTWGSLATAVAAGTLMGLSRRELRNAIGIVGSSTVSLGIARRGEVSMWKGIATAYATHGGIQACQMARAGVTGPEAVFEGPAGFFEVVADRELTVDRLGGRDGANYRIMDAHLKPFPCGYYMQPMIAGVQALVEDHDIDPDAVEEIVIHTFAEAAGILADETKWSTDLTRESADHSIPYTTAIAILYGDVTPDHYRATYRNDPTVHALMERVGVEESKDLTEFVEDNPDATPTIVEIVADGQRYETRLDHAPGHARNPFSRDRLEAKLTEQAAGLLTDDQVDSLVELCNDLGTLNRVDPIVDATIV